MDYHKAIGKAWENVREGYGTQAIISTEEGSYEFRVVAHSVMALATHEFVVNTITAWPTATEAETT